MGKEGAWKAARSGGEVERKSSRAGEKRADVHGRASEPMGGWVSVSAGSLDWADGAVATRRVEGDEAGVAAGGGGS